MQRKIEFRGKRKDNNEWIYGDLYQEKKPYTKTNEIKEVMIVEYRPDLCLVSGAPNHNHWWREIIPETIGQFTGLKDKNGVKIFEGDIVKSPDGDLEEITYDSITFNLLIAYASDKQKYLNEFKIGDISQELEVVGNIHDNPELLNK